ncbi:MAG TPA: amidohydrolase [Thermoanaerobaculia bacterium]|nr:amidohydrolase [Thermoanaerobaculia bacterium]
MHLHLRAGGLAATALALLIALAGCQSSPRGGDPGTVGSSAESATPTRSRAPEPTPAGELDDAALVVTNGTVVTMDAKRTVIERGAVAIVDGRIAAVGTAAEVEAAHAGAERIDARGGIVLPGLINAHTHAAMVLFRGLVDDLDLLEWLERYIFPAEAEHVDEDFVRVGTRLACLEMLLGGTTTMVDLYYYEDAVAEEVERCGMRGVLGQTVIGFPAPDFATAEEAMAAARRLAERWRGHPRIVPAVAPHALYTLTAEQMTAAHALARELDVPLLTHLSEDRSEIERVRARTGTTSIEALEALGVLDHRLLGAHVVVASPAEIALLARRGVGVAHCPQSNMKVGAGAAPVPAMIAAGVAVGIGTDGAASNNDLDLWDEIDTAAKLHKLQTGDPKVLDARQALAMATIEGARAIDLDGEIGSLEPGKRADLVVVSVGGLHQQPQRPMPNPYSLLVYATKASDVETVIVEGRVVVRDGRVLTLDAEEVIRQAAAKREKLEMLVPPPEP